MEYSKSRANPLLILFTMCISLVIGIGAFTYIPLEVMFALMALLFLVFLLVEVPMTGLYATLFFLPVFWSVFFDMQLLGISGLKISVVLPLVAFLYLYFIVIPRGLEGNDQAYLAILFGLFAIAVIRSFPYLQTRSVTIGDKLSVFSHISTNFIRPFMLLLLVIVIASYVRAEWEIVTTTKVVVCSVLAAFTLMLISIAGVPFTDFEDIRTVIQDMSGMHPGYFANYFLCLIPLTLMLAIKMRWKACYILCAIEVVGVTLTFSRASYGVGIVSILLTLVVCKKFKVIFGIAIASPFLYSFIPNFVVERALTGLAENNVSVISAGRVDSIWKPLLQELSSNPRFLLFGNGRYGIYNTTSYRTGASFSVNNAHNILLDCVCDGGIIALIFFVLFFAHYIRKFYRVARLTTNPLYQCILMGSILGVLGFIVKGTTDGVFWPESSNAIVYVLLGLSIAVVYRFNEKHEYITKVTKEEEIREK